VFSFALKLNLIISIIHLNMPKVPAHRVVNRNGLLTGKHHFATPYQMQELLEKEKIKVANDKIIHFEKYYWDPLVELL